MHDFPWIWILWSVAAIMAISSLVNLSIARRDELQGKLDKYVTEQVTLVRNKRTILAEHRRRSALAKRLAEEQAREDAEEQARQAIQQQSK